MRANPVKTYRLANVGSLRPLPCRRSCRKQLHPICAELASRSISSRQALVHPNKSAKDYDDFELIWLEYRKELSVGRDLAAWVLSHVQSGRLPCDVTLVRQRITSVLELPKVVAGLDARALLNSSKETLTYDSRSVSARVLCSDHCQLPLPLYVPEYASWTQLHINQPACCSQVQSMPQQLLLRHLPFLTVASPSYNPHVQAIGRCYQPACKLTPPL